MKIPYETAWDAGEGIGNEFYSEKNPLHLRLWPYNTYDANEPKNWWWLSPSKQMVAHQHGKFLFAQDDDGNIRIGLAIEKGIGEGYAVIPDYKQWTLSKDWQWHRVYADLANGEMERALSLVQERAGTVPMLLLDWNTWPIKPIIRGHAYFTWDRKKGLTCSETNDPAFKEYKTLASVKSALAKHISEPNSWCDFRAMLPFEPAPADSKGCWTAKDIKVRLLEPFEKWVE